MKNDEQEIWTSNVAEDVHADRAIAIQYIVGFVCSFVAGILSWVLFFGALSGNWWAMGGLSLSISTSTLTALLVNGFKNEQ